MIYSISSCRTRKHERYYMKYEKSVKSFDLYSKHYNNHFYDNASFNLKTFLNLQFWIFDQEPSPLITGS